MIRRSAAGLALATLAACTPNLGDEPFACDTDGACPGGFTCQSTICVAAGAQPDNARPMRIDWINSAEMYWFPSVSGGGATLVVNDGFTPGHRGLYEIVVDTSGNASTPRLLAKYGEEFPTSSSVGLLDDNRYAVATLTFPNVSGDSITMTVSAIDRELPAGQTPSIETLYTDEEPYLGGSEPAYISALVQGKSMDVAFTRPQNGGGVAITHIEQNGSVWASTRTATAPLPDGVLPLSGDCLLWKNGTGLTLRVGFESFAVLDIDMDGNATPFVPIQDSDVPLYAWADDLLLLRYGDQDPTTNAYAVQYVLSTNAPKDIAVDDGGPLQATTEPYTAVPYGDGAIFAPLSKDAAFSTIDVGYRSPTESLRRIASIHRDSTDLLYSARPFITGGYAFVAWTSFHEALMDLWVAATPAAIANAPESASMSKSKSAPMSAPHRVRSIPVSALPMRPWRGRR